MYNAFKILAISILVLFFLYLLIVSLFYFFQERLLFFPQGIPASLPSSNCPAESIHIELDKKNSLKGWYLKTSIAKQKVIIYFGGNAEEVSFMIPFAAQLNYSLLLINYPGYGESTGKPGEREFFTAATAIYDYLIMLPDTDPDNIVVMGRSIGTGVATFMASQRHVRGVILISPYGSIRNVAKDKLMFLPVDLILRHKFESVVYAKKIEAPLLCIYSTDDTIIPPKHSQELFESWRGDKKKVELTGYGHNGVFTSDKLWREIDLFLKNID